MARRSLDLAEQLRASGRPADAIPHLQRAILMSPKDANLQIALGELLVQTGQIRQAIAAMTEATQVDPDHATAHVRLAMLCMYDGLEPQALAAALRAVEIAPRQYDAQLLAGHLLRENARRAEAIAAFRAAEACAPSRGAASYAAGFACFAEERLDDAVAAFTRSMTLGHRPDDCREVSATIQLQQGRFEAGHATLRTLLANDPIRARAAHKYAETRKATPDDAALLTRMAEQAASAKPRPRQDRMLLHAALGKSHDDLGQHAQAMHHFDAANAQRSAIGRLDRHGHAATIDRLIADHPAGSQGQAGASDESRPILIVGTPRSGTTLVEQILSSHHLVAAGGEIPFWSQRDAALLRMSRAEQATQLPQLAARYSTLLDGISPQAARITDKNPFNFQFLGPILRALPHARVIHLRRHPFDACLSMHTTFFADRATYFMGNREDLLVWYQEYQRIMAHWRAVLPANQLIDIDYEAIIDDREAQTRRLVNFCGLEWDDACLRPQDNRRPVNTASLWQARQPVYRGSIGRWRNYAAWFEGFDVLLQSG